MAEIKLSNGRIVLVDDEDLSLVRGYSWYLWSPQKSKTLYVRADIRAEGVRKAVYMHRLITGATRGYVVDHINGCGYDNRRSNLRICLQGENSRNHGMRRNNTSGYKGVTWDKRSGKWQAQIKINRKTKVVGHFDDPVQAHAAYCKAALVFHGRFANFGKAD